MNTTLSQGFVRGITANLSYWRERLADLTDEKLKEINLDHSNLRRAVEFGLVLDETHRLTAELALAAFPLIEQGGYWEAWIPILERLRTGTAVNDRTLQFHMSKRLGQLLRFNGQFLQAIATHETALQIAQQLNDPHAIADANLNLSEDHRLYQAYSKAERYGVVALEIFTILPETKRWLVSTLNTLGLVALAVEDLDGAEARLQEAVIQGRMIEQPTYLARMLNNLAFIQQKRGKFPEALTYYQEALHLLADTASELDKTRVLLSLGSLQFDMEQYDQAETSFRQADSVALRQLGDTYLQAVLGQNLGNVLLKKERYVEAETYLRRSLLLRRFSNSPLRLANTLGTLAEVLAAQNRLQEACAAYDEALAILTNYPDDTWAQELQQQFTVGREKLRSND